MALGFPYSCVKASMWVGHGTAMMDGYVYAVRFGINLFSAVLLYHVQDSSVILSSLYIQKEGARLIHGEVN